MLVKLRVLPLVALKVTQWVALRVDSLGNLTVDKWEFELGTYSVALKATKKERYSVFQKAKHLGGEKVVKMADVMDGGWEKQSAELTEYKKG